MACDQRKRSFAASAIAAALLRRLCTAVLERITRGWLTRPCWHRWDHCLSRPSRWATAAASPRPATPSLARIRETWTLAVLGVINSAWPICRLVRPSATSASTSISRRVRPSEAAGEGGASGDAVVSAGSSRRRRPRWASTSTSRRSGSAPSATVVWWAAHSAASLWWRDAPPARSASASRKCA